MSAPEASFLASWVDPRGALTVSADFSQIVSPVHGIQEVEAIKYGCSIVDRTTDMSFPFSKNMRQTKEIARFLQSFYSCTFGRSAPFVANNNLTDIKPQLYILKSIDFSLRIRQIFNIVKRSHSIKTVALIQINENERELMNIREQLEDKGIPMAPIWESFSEDGNLITSSVERIKGLEFDCCIVLGIDNIEESFLNFTRNRIYVAVSRATLRLAMLCESFPQLLQKVNQQTYDIFQSTMYIGSKHIG